MGPLQIAKSPPSPQGIRACLQGGLMRRLFALIGTYGMGGLGSFVFLRPVLVDFLHMEICLFALAAYAPRMITRVTTRNRRLVS